MSRVAEPVGLVDANGYYPACEEVFDPTLRGRPVGVLSNNDGCIVAMNEELKKLGIKRGTPLFQCRALLKKHNAVVLSSNYALYADMSRRLMATIETQVPKIEVYSIDECFVWLPGFSPAELDTQATKIRRIVKQNVGLPVSVGVAWTKTLAKLANSRSKKDERWKDLGVCNLTTFSITELEKLLSEVGVEDVWGIGHRRAEFLHHHGINTAYDLANAPDRWLLKHLTVVGLRTALELRGQPCIPAELAPVPKKSIISSKAFGRPIESLDELSQAVATYVSRLGEKLRHQHSVASTLEVYIHTSHFAKGRERYANAITIRLDQPTAYTPALVAAARRGLEKIYKPGVLYAKAGVMVMGLQSENARQLNLWHQGEGDPVILERNRRLMEAVDELNYRFGRGTIQVGAAGLKKEWSMRRERLSQRYTTRWDELLVV